MSLVKLTFGGRDPSAANAIGKGKLKVVKTDKFFGTEAVCVIGTLVEGALSVDMCIPQRNAKIQSLESNYGDDYCVKEGAKVTLMVSGINKSDFQNGDDIEFEKLTVITEKPKGRFIIA
ncbi:MAG: hypothetical protein WC308_03155 [archaeon]